MLYVLCLDICWLWSLLISSCTTLLLQSQWPCSSSSMLDLTQHRVLAMLFPPSVMFCLEIWTEWIFFFPPKLFSVRGNLATLLKSTTTLHHLSRPQYSPDLLPPQYFSPWDLLSSHMLSFLLIYYVVCFLHKSINFTSAGTLVCLSISAST